MLTDGGERRRPIARLPTLAAVGGDASFGALLRRYRRQAGLSQEELAARALVSTRAISDLERGVNARPRLHTAVALADGLALAGAERSAFERHARPVADTADEHGPSAPRPLSPVPVDAFVDDGTSLAEVLALVSRHRMVTLMGPGGVGKSRLVLETAARLDAPVAFVPLASLHEPTLLAATIGAALGVEHGPTRTHLESLVEHLAARHLVLVLDNMEQIAAAAADVATLLGSCPDLRVVATSRVPLRIAGETCFVVPPLAATGTDPATRPAVRLFVERAAAAGWVAGPGAGEVDAVAELCRRLDGLPLAIELAAARSRILSPGDMLRHLDDVLDLLSVGRSDAAAHQGSMRAALEWSVRLLPPAAQEAFAALGAFAASASSDAVMAVWGDPALSTATYFERLQALADAHLVTIERPDADGGGPRIDMFETTRQFAREQLDESASAASVRARAARWAVDFVARAEVGMTGPDQREWLARVERELPNLRAVERRLAAGTTDDDVDTALRLAAGLQLFWDIRSRWSEGVTWLCDALAVPGGSPAVRGKARKALGVMYRCLGDLDAAEVEQQQAVELYRAAEDEPGMAACLNNRGVIAIDRAQYSRARGVLREALALCRAHGDERLEAVMLNNLGLTALELGDLREALRLCRRSSRLLATHGNVSARTWPQDNLATTLTRAGHPRWAVPIHERTIRQRLELADEGGSTWSLEALAEAWTAIGETDRAGRAIGFVAAHRGRLGTLPVPCLDALTTRRSAALVARIGAARFAELWDEGAALEPAHVREWFTA